MEQQLDTLIIFNDIKDICLEIEKTESPKTMRRLLSIFLIQTQQLTDIMRKEFSILTNKKWEAKSFNGWNETSSYFKKLRNIHVHETLAKINVHINSQHKIVFPDIDQPLFLCTSSILKLDDQLQDENPPPLIISRLEKDGIKEVQSEIQSVKYSYVLVDKYFSDIQLHENHQPLDLKILIRDYFNTLCTYYDFYTGELSKILGEE